MGRRGRRVRIAPGVYSDGSGIAARVRVGSDETQRSREKRFKPGTDLIEIKRWQLRTRAELLEAQPAKPDAGLLAAAVPHYLATLTGRRRKDDQALLQHWIDSPLGNYPRHAITRSMVLTQLATWETAGHAASSINHRLRVLRSLYRTLDANDDHAINPTFDIKKRREPEAEPRAVSLDLIEAIIAFMPERGRPTAGVDRPTMSQTKARARVMAWTGLPPAQLKQVQEPDVDWTAGTLRVTPRRKGKGTKARIVPLHPEAQNALRWFFACRATGPFSTSGFYKTWATAQRRLRKEIARLRHVHPSQVDLPPIRPLDLRHSFLTEAYRRSTNVLGVAALALHARVSTTQRYVTGATEEAARQVIASMVPPGAPHASHSLALTRAKRPILKNGARGKVASKTG